MSYRKDCDEFECLEFVRRAFFSDLGCAKAVS